MNRDRDDINDRIAYSIMSMSQLLKEKLSDSDISTNDALIKVLDEWLIETLNKEIPEIDENGILIARAFLMSLIKRLENFSNEDIGKILKISMSSVMDALKVVYTS